MDTLIKKEKSYNFVYFLFILFWIALPEIIFLLINKEPARFLLNTIAFFSLFLSPAFLYRNHVRLFALLLFPIIILSIINLACIYYYNTPIIDYLLVLVLNTNFQESTEFIKGHIWTSIFSTSIYVLVYGYLITKIKDNINYKKALRISLVSILVIILLPFTDHSDKKYIQKMIGTFYTIFPTSLIYSIKSVYTQYHLVNTNGSIKKSFKFNATQQDNNNEKQIHVLVIGESASFYHWSASGYNRKTTPRIDTTSNLFFSIILMHWHLLPNFQFL